MNYLKKYLKKFLKDQSGVTPVVGVILMVAVTVVMGAVIAGFVYGYVGSTEQGPLLGLNLKDDPSTASTFLLKHTGGETMLASDWKISVTLGEDTPTRFDNASAVDDDADEVIRENPADLSAGTTLTIIQVTDGTDGGTGGNLTAATYHVVIVHSSSNSLLLDTNIQVRD